MAKRKPRQTDPDPLVTVVAPNGDTVKVSPGVAKAIADPPEGQTTSYKIPAKKKG